MISLNVAITGGIALKLGRKEQAQINEAIALDLQDNLRTCFEDRGGRSFWADAARATVVESDGNDRLPCVCTSAASGTSGLAPLRPWAVRCAPAADRPK